ncbi:MAG TPA: A/G-specific adenine glycosylase [Nevskiaceae bacterium]|nr:A/G-specific adenine glycosylase [Nevskiaceae bacterium]
MNNAPTRDFAERLLAWYDRAGRHDLPWQHPRTPYRVWVAEIMLQQTQVTTVVPYFASFMARFPDVGSLAAAPLDDVLACWSGLGYYARARHLHVAAQHIMASGAETWPTDLVGWRALPGVGRSTAGAILAQAFGRRCAILDGNVRRVFARHAGVEGWPGEPAVTRRLWELAEQRLPHLRLADYTQAQMDLGALICTTHHPQCEACPVADDCVARAHGSTDRLPTARPRRERPRRILQLLLVCDGEGRWLVQRRAATGFWGGLWCPPLVAGSAEQRATCARLGIRPGTWRRLPTVKHGFTHFDLQLQPRRCEAVATPRVADDDLRWLPAEQVLGLGLPAPIRRLFESL